MDIQDLIKALKEIARDFEYTPQQAQRVTVCDNVTNRYDIIGVRLEPFNEDGLNLIIDVEPTTPYVILNQHPGAEPCGP